MLEKARSEMERAAALAPTVAEPHLHLGWIHALRGEEAAATESFNQVLKLDPTNNGYRNYVGLWFAEVARKREG
jgi:Flp pilus assembly protein TadD